jgi:hypothetical protein
MEDEEAKTLEPDMLLHCSRCGRWHPVRYHREGVGTTEYANAMLFWECGGKRFYAGQTGSTSRHPLRRPRRTR